jgi:drug/metabolite transporter (DMT)-like permease
MGRYAGPALMPPPVPYIGEALSLLTAVVWAVAVILFKKSGEHVHPLALNLFKDVLALVLFVPTIYVLGGTLFRDAPAWHYGLLLASGALGIGAGDTLFFKSLNHLGASLTAVVDCLYSPFVILLSLAFLKESLSALQLAGAAAVVSAVLVASLGERDGPLSRRDLALGIIYGVLAHAAMAVGIVMVKPLLEVSPLLWVTEVRIVGGVAALALAVAFIPRRRAVLASLAAGGRWGYTIAGSLVGAYLAMVLWLAGMKFAPASVSSALNQTSNVFVFLFAALFLREPLTWRRFFALALGLAGAYFVSFG